VDRGPQLLLQPPPPLLRVLEVHGRGRATGGVVGPASTGGVAPPVLDHLVDSAGSGVRGRDSGALELGVTVGTGELDRVIFFKLGWAEVLPEQYPAIPGPKPQYYIAHITHGTITIQ
jgi:hypothetical protein